MRRTALLTVPVLALSTWAPAQTARFTIYPYVSPATSRSAIANTEFGDLLTQVETSSFRGVGRPQAISGAWSGRLLGFEVTIQSLAGAEPFNYVIYGDDPQSPGRPSRLSAFRSATLLTPGAGAWLITTTFGTPAAVLPLEQTWYFGVGLFPSPGGGDGASIHMAPYAALGPPFPRAADNPRAGAPHLTWTVRLTSTGSAVGQPLPERIHEMKVLIDNVVLNNGADIAAASRNGPNPCFGVAGLYPDNSGRADGLAFRVRAPQSAGDQVLVIASPSFASPVGAPFLEGFFLIDLSTLLPIASGTMPVAGELVLQPPALAQGRLPTGISGTVAFQVFTVGALIRASNATVTSFR